MTDLLDDLLEAWNIHDGINLFILDWVPDEGLDAVTLLKTGKPSPGRNVARIFAPVRGALRTTRAELRGVRRATAVRGLRVAVRR